MSQETVRSASTNSPSPEGPAGARRAVTRRDFVRCAGLGLGSFMAATPIAALAEETAGEETPADAAALADATAAVSPDITDSFEFGGSSKADFIFHQSFFDGSSFTYSSQVATFGLCLALASFGANDDREKYADSPNKAKAFFQKMQCGDVTVNDCYTAPTQHDSIGLICGHRQIQADGKDYELVMMGIRGANYFMESCGNFAAGKEGDHEGFNTVANMALDFLKDYVGNHVPADRPLKVIVTGFSRAGAAANMLGGLLVRNAWNKQLPTSSSSHPESDYPGYILGGKYDGQTDSFPFPKHEVCQKDVYVYGYEAPSGVYSGGTVDRAILDWWNSHNKTNPFGNIHTIVNPCDYVPMVMPIQWTFGRHGVDHLLPRPKDDKYKERRDAMLARADAIDKNIRSAYPVDKFDHLNTSMDNYFNTMYDKLVHDLTGSRATYNRDYQTPLVDLMDYVQSGKIYKIKEVATSRRFLAWMWMEVLGRIVTEIADLGFVEVIKFSWELIRGTLISSMLEEVVIKLRACGLEWGDEEEKVYEELLRICPMIQKFALRNVRLFVTMIQTFVQDDISEIHSGSLCLAWVQSYDANYTDGTSAAALLCAEGQTEAEGGDDGDGDATDVIPTTSVYKKVLFDGKISVWMAGETGYVKLFDEGNRVETEDFPYYYGLNEDFQMFILLPPKTEFMFRIESDPQELFSITGMRYEMGSEVPARVLSYNAIGNDLETMYATVVEGAIWVSATENRHDAYDYAVEIDNEDGDAQTHCNIVLSSADDEAGYVIGGGYNVYGTSSMLAAVPAAGYEFDYWTVDGEKDTSPVTTTEVEVGDGTKVNAASYPLYVAKDYGESVGVVAHFKKQEASPAPEAEDSSQAQGGAAKRRSGIPATGDAASGAAAVAGVVAAGIAAAGVGVAVGGGREADAVDAAPGEKGNE